MDGGAVAGPAVAGAPDARSGTLRIERAIFTSIRSPMGEGYRIVAASKGISSDEKRAITRCAPSHGSLCDPAGGATALASFVLDSGRRCVFLSANRGTEHTARGGCCVYTHVLVVDPEAFRRFHCDPFELEAAALPQLGNEQDTAPPPRLEPLTLRSGAEPAGLSGAGGRSQQLVTPADRAFAADDYERIDGVLRAFLEQLAIGPSGHAAAGPRAGRSLLVVGAPRPQRVLGRVLAATPAALRERLSLSYGLRFSPARRFRLVLTDASSNERDRIERDRELDVIAWDSPPPSESGPFDRWLRFVRQRWEAGRAGEVACLSAELTDGWSPALLGQIARLTTDIERARTADEPLLRELVRAHQDDDSATSAQRRLLKELRHLIQERRAVLEQQRQEASAAAERASAAGTCPGENTL